MTRRYDCADPTARSDGLDAAVAAVGRGQLVVLPTDTVYGIGADAFSASGVAALLEAKGRGRDMPVPVLVPSARTLDGLAKDVGDVGRALVEAFWPGGLTLVCRQQPTLAWDLGDTDGTVALRMPLHPVALELLTRVGPMAVSSANRMGMPPAVTVDEAFAQLGEQVEVYLDGGTCEQALPSTIIDVTGALPRVLRQGAIPLDLLGEVVPSLRAG